MLGNFILEAIFIFELLFFKSSKFLKTTLVFNSIYLRTRRCLLMICLIVLVKLIRIEALSKDKFVLVWALGKWLSLLLCQNYQYYMLRKLSWNFTLGLVNFLRVLCKRINYGWWNVLWKDVISNALRKWWKHHFNGRIRIIIWLFLTYFRAVKEMNLIDVFHILSLNFKLIVS